MQSSLVSQSPKHSGHGVVEEHLLIPFHTSTVVDVGSTFLSDELLFVLVDGCDVGTDVGVDVDSIDVGAFVGVVVD
jgi:hypothetical protein